MCYASLSIRILKESNNVTCNINCIVDDSYSFSRLKTSIGPANQKPKQSSVNQSNAQKNKVVSGLGVWWLAINHLNVQLYYLHRGQNGILFPCKRLQLNEQNLANSPGSSGNPGGRLRMRLALLNWHAPIRAKL